MRIIQVVQRQIVKSLINRLRQLRQVHGLSQEAFAEISGISYKYYQQIEGGRKPDLRLSTLERLAHAYGIQVFELLAPELPKTKLAKVRLTKPVD